jgi:hypothetical protein
VASQDSSPLQLVYTELWRLPMLNPEFRALVREGNMIRFDHEAHGNPRKDQVQAGDLPEVTLTSETSAVKIHETSSTCKLIRQYSWLVATGDFRLTHLLAPVEWALFVSMIGWQRVLGRLKWHDKAFCKRMDVVSVLGGRSDPQLNRGIAGWSAIWRCEVEMHFATADLLEELEPIEP